MTHHSVIRTSGQPNVSGLSSKACANGRIGRMTWLRIYPLLSTDSGVLLVSLPTVEHGSIWYKLL